MAKKIKSSYEIYDTLNDGRLNASYIETEGENCIRVDFPDDTSVWFDICKSGNYVRGRTSSYNMKTVKIIAKELGFKIEKEG